MKKYLLIFIWLLFLIQNISFAQNDSIPNFVKSSSTKAFLFEKETLFMGKTKYIAIYIIKMRDLLNDSDSSKWIRLSIENSLTLDEEKGHNFDKEELDSLVKSFRLLKIAIDKKRSSKTEVFFALRSTSSFYLGANYKLPEMEWELFLYVDRQKYVLRKSEDFFKIGEILEKAQKKANF